MSGYELIFQAGRDRVSLSHVVKEEDAELTEKVLDVDPVGQLVLVPIGLTCVTSEDTCVASVDAPGKPGAPGGPGGPAGPRIGLAGTGERLWARTVTLGQIRYVYCMSLKPLVPGDKLVHTPTGQILIVASFTAQSSGNYDVQLSNGSRGGGFWVRGPHPLDPSWNGEYAALPTVGELWFARSRCCTWKIDSVDLNTSLITNPTTLTATQPGLSPIDGPRFPPQKGDVWKHNENSTRALRELGKKVVFTGNSTNVWGSLFYEAEDQQVYGEHWFNYPDGGLTFVSRGDQVTGIPSRPHKCNRCGSQALIMTRTVECTNKSCANYVP